MNTGRGAILIACLALALAGCQTLKNMAVEVGEVVSGVDRDPNVTSDAESIVAGLEAAQPLLPFPVRESIAAILSGLAVYTVVSKKKKVGDHESAA